MSFSTDIKQELIKIKLRGGEVRKAQLAGITHAAGTLRLGRALMLEYTTETHEVGLQIASLATGLYDVEAQVAVREASHRKLTLTSVLLVGQGVERLLEEAGLFSRGEEGVLLRQSVPEKMTAADSCGKAFLRGAFLGAGSCSDPWKAYHLEIVCGSPALAQALCLVMENLGCPAKTVWRKEKTVVYLKEGDLVASFLALVGANVATLTFENARAERELRNLINRQSNCETANIGKVVNAAGEQLDAIEKIKATHGLEKLSPVLRETAELRLNNPELSLAELAELAGMKKSGMNSRLQRLIRYAQELR